MSSPIEVTATGFSWTAGGAWTACMMLAVVLIRQLGPWRKQATDQQDKFLNDVLARLSKVEAEFAAAQRQHRIEIARVSARNAAQRSLDRHRFNNSEGCFDSLLVLLSATELDDRLKLAIRDVQERRTRQRAAEAQEAAIIHAAEIRAVQAAEQDVDAEGMGAQSPVDK